MQLTGRILWLTDDLAQLQQQLMGVDPNFDPLDPPPLHFGVNTDAMINGAACTLGYTGDILGPYFLQNFKDVVEVDTVRTGGFQVVVGGDAYGSGSSREVAVVAHQGAGIELVVARSFQRIFQENMVYAGLPFTSDFGVIDRLRAGRERRPRRARSRAAAVLPSGERSRWPMFLIALLLMAVPSLRVVWPAKKKDEN